MLPIIEDEKLFSRILTKESSTSNSSFRVFYEENPVCVPFVWESKPGTPKHPKQNVSNFLEDNNYVPPLTPPPSYHINQAKKTHNNSSKKSSRGFQGLFPKMILRRQNSSSSSSSSLPTLSSISSLSSTVSTSEQRTQVQTLSNSGSEFEYGVNNDHYDEEEEGDEDMESPKSVMCFGIVGSRKNRSSIAAYNINKG